MANKYYEEFIDFFKKYNLYNEEIFNYLRENAILFDYRDEDCDYRYFISCTPNVKNDILRNIKMIVPYPDNDITNLINVHEYMHGIELYPYLNKYFDYEKYKKYGEMMPILMERLYCLEHPSENLKEEMEYLDKKIEDSDDKKYKFALDKANELLDYFNETKDIKKVQKKAKKLVRKQ